MVGRLISAREYRLLFVSYQIWTRFRICALCPINFYAYASPEAKMDMMRLTNKISSWRGERVLIPRGAYWSRFLYSAAAYDNMVLEFSVW